MHSGDGASVLVKKRCYSEQQQYIPTMLPRKGFGARSCSGEGASRSGKSGIGWRAVWGGREAAAGAPEPS